MAVKKQERGSYNKPLRTQAMQEIRRLLVVEAYTYDEIMQQVGLSERTFYRYLSAIFSHNRQLLTERVGDEEVLNQMAILQARISKQCRDLQEMANDKEVDSKARVSAHHLVGEMAVVIMKLYAETPSILASRHKFPETSLTAPDSSSLRLKLSSPLPYTVIEKEEEELEEEEKEMKR